MASFHSFNDFYLDFLHTAGIKKKFIVENSEMSKHEKEGLISELRQLQINNNGGVLIGVQGGSLSEGIDYSNNLLNGIIVVGIPFAPPSIETYALIDYYKRQFGTEIGYYYSYVFPAVNKSTQSAGRGIRSETDRVVIVFMDERFGQKRYSKCFPPDYELVVTSIPWVKCKEFWNSWNKGGELEK
jgi:DNA excision repair protein ERCC-2